MIALECRGCGRAGRVPERLAGSRVSCTRCRAANVVPAADTLEVFVADWMAAIACPGVVTGSESPTAVVEIPAAI